MTVTGVSNLVLPSEVGRPSEPSEHGLSRKQAAWVHMAVTDPTARHLIAEGETGSGKSGVNAMAWAAWAWSPYAPSEGEHLFVGRSMSSIQSNICSQFRNPALFGELAELATFKSRRDGGFDLWGKQVRFITANDPKNAFQRLSGANAASALVDEMIFLDPMIVKEIPHRLRAGGPGAVQKSFWSTNPDGPDHYVKREYIDLANSPGQSMYEAGWRRARFTMDDNPSLDPGRKSNLILQTSGAERLRRVFGIWAAPGNQVFSFERSRDMVRYEDVPEIGRILAVGIDYGETAPSAVVILGVAADESAIYALGELYLTTQEGGSVRTQPTLVGEIASYLNGVGMPGGSSRPVIEKVVYDAAAAGFGSELRASRELQARVIVKSRKGAGSILRGVRRLENLFTTKKLIVTDRCPNLASELMGYAWDMEATKAKGVDTLRSDCSDHAIDALRYAVDSVWTECHRIAGLDRLLLGSRDDIED